MSVDCEKTKKKTHVPSLKKPTSGYEKPVVTPERARQEPGGGGGQLAPTTWEL